MKRIALLATLVAAIVISDGAFARGGGGSRGGGLRSSGVSHGGPGWSGFSAGQGRFALAVRAGVSRRALSQAASGRRASATASRGAAIGAVVPGRFAAVSRAVRWHHHPGRGWRRFDAGFGPASGAGFGAVALPRGSEPRRAPATRRSLSVPAGRCSTTASPPSPPGRGSPTRPRTCRARSAAPMSSAIRVRTSRAGAATTESRKRTFRPRGPEAHFQPKTWISAGVMMTTNSTGRKNRIIGTVSFGGSAAAFFSASFMRMSRLSCDSTRSACPSGVP